VCTIAPPPIRQDDPFPGYGHATRRHTAYSGSMMGFGNSTENCVGIRRPFVSKRAIHRRAHAQCIHVKTYVPVVTTYRVGVNRKGAAQQPHEPFVRVELVRYLTQTKHRQIEIHAGSVNRFATRISILPRGRRAEGPISDARSRFACSSYGVRMSNACCWLVRTFPLWILPSGVVQQQAVVRVEDAVHGTCRGRGRGRGLVSISVGVSSQCEL
jgi:hypothetical protein